MGLIIVNLSKTIRWNIKKDDPCILPLNSYPGCFFINPLSYNIVISHSSLLKFEAVIEDRALVNSGTLIFISSTYDYLDFDEFKEYLENFIAGLRFLSKQPEIGGIYIENIYTTSIFFDDDYLISNLSLEWPRTYPKFDNNITFTYKVAKYQVDTSVTWDHIIISEKTVLGNKLPVFDALLLDAISAFMEGDYRRAILYSAISMETMVSERLEEIYMSIMEKGDPNNSLRIISLPQRQGKAVTKDPVYEYLASRVEFKQRLHEQSLYVLKRSLLLENEVLYQDALKLYSTRNKIVHSGEPPIQQKNPYFYTNKIDAMKAINCTIEVFQWFGISDKYIIPSSEMVDASMPVSERFDDKDNDNDDNDDNYIQP